MNMLRILGLLLMSAGVSGVDRSSEGFEVVSIKQAAAPSDAVPYFLSMATKCGLPGVLRSGTRVSIPVASVCGLIRLAYSVPSYEIVDVPRQLEKGEISNLFQIEAKLEDGSNPTPDDVRDMLKVVLAERFDVRLHYERRRLVVHALVVEKGGLKETRCSEPEAPSSYMKGRITSCAPPMNFARLAEMLTRELGQPVVDMTGVSRPYSFDLRWLPDGISSDFDADPALATALREQLGLRLERRPAEVECLIIDHAEAPDPD